MSDEAQEECIVVKHKCIQCNKTKCETNFRILRGERRDVCLNCDSKNTREVQTRKLRKEFNVAVDDIPGHIKHCRACDEVKSINDFGKDKSKDGHYSKCGECAEGGKKLMTNAELSVFRAGKAEVLAEKAEEVVDDFKVEVSEAAKDKVSAVVSDGKELVEDVKDVVEEVTEEVKEHIEEAKGFFVRVRAWWKNLF